MTNEESQRNAAAAAAARADPTKAAASHAPDGGIPGGAAGVGAAGADSQMTLQKVVYRLKKWKHLLECRVFRAPSEVPLQRCSPYLAQVRWSTKRLLPPLPLDVCEEREGRGCIGLNTIV